MAARSKAAVPPLTTREQTPQKPGGRRQHAKATRSDGQADVNVPQTKARGNAAMDERWLAAHEAELVAIDEGEEVPFGIRMRWTGKAEDIGSEFQIPNPERRCTGMAYVRDTEGRHIIDSDGLVLVRPCGAWRLPGAAVCMKHGGGRQAVMNAAKRRLIAAADPAVGQMIAIMMDDDAELETKLRAAAQILDRAGLRAGVEITVDTPEWQRMLQDMYESGEVPAPALPAAPPRRPTRKAVGT